MTLSIAPLPLFTFKQKLVLMKNGIFNWTIPTYTTGDELIQLYVLSSNLPQNSLCVEIGSYLGASTLMIAKGLKNSSKLICIDTWKNDAMSEGNWDSFNLFKKNTLSVKNKLELIRSSSIKAVNYLIEDEIDFLFIDGDHSYDAVKSDFDIWFPKLKGGGLIIMHDCGWAEGVIRVINQDILPNVMKSKTHSNIFWGWKKL
jgi:predicted O-methyltransferase YrrM